jgi:hypothetical protein
MNGALKRALFKWDPKAYGSVDEAEAALAAVYKRVVDRYVPVKTRAVNLPAPWWNYTCARKLQYKIRVFQQLEAGVVDSSKYLMAARICRKVQKKAYACFQKKLKQKIGSMGSSDKNFWSLAKDISGLSQERHASCPSVDAIADHFAEKMSNGRGVEAASGSVSRHKPVPLRCWRVRFKQVLKSL